MSEPSVGRIAASCQGHDTGRSRILRRPFPTQPRFEAERLGGGPFRFPGDPRRCPESCTFGRRTFRGLVPTQPRTGWCWSCQRIPGCCTSGSRSYRDSDPIHPTLQKMIRYMSIRHEENPYIGLERVVGKETGWRRRSGCRWQS